MAKRLRFGIILVALCAVAWWLGSNVMRLPQAAADPLPEILSLSVDRKDADFDTAWRGASFVKVLHVKNTSASVQRVNWEVSCDCVDVEPSQSVFQPNETQTIKLTVNLNVLSPCGLKNANAYNFAIKPILPGQKVPRSMWMFHVPLAALFLEPIAFDFGEIVAGHAQPKQTARIKTAAQVPLTVKCDPGKFIASVKDGVMSLEPGPSLPVGLIDETLVVEADLPGRPNLHVKIKGRKCLEVEVEPNRVLVGPGFEKQQVRLVSRGGTFRVLGFKTQDDTTKVRRQEPSVFDIEQAIVGKGSQNRHVSFTVEMQDKRRFDVPLDINYFGR